MTHSLAVPDLRKFVESRQTCTKTHFSDVCEPFQAKKNFHHPNFLPGHSPIKIRVFEASRSQLSADFSIHKAIFCPEPGRVEVEISFKTSLGHLFGIFMRKIFFEFFDPPPPPPPPPQPPPPPHLIKNGVFYPRKPLNLTKSTRLSRRLKRWGDRKIVPRRETLFPPHSLPHPANIVFPKPKRASTDDALFGSPGSQKIRRESSNLHENPLF